MSNGTPMGPKGEIRGLVPFFALWMVTFGMYGIYWYFNPHFVGTYRI